MTKLDLNTLSLLELKQLQKDLLKAIANFDGKKKSEARATLEAHAKSLGFTFAELLGGTPNKPRTLATPKYRHSNDTSVTWSGRGRQPFWFKDAISSGKSATDLAI